MTDPDCLLGFDIGSSFVKASVIRSATGELIASASSPDVEMQMISEQPGWAEQDPEIWWSNVVNAANILVGGKKVSPSSISAIGISYQMHGLVVIDKSHRVLRPSIIWCDSRATEIGKNAFEALGREYCLEHYLNSPGNFTASKLKWVKDNEPDLFRKIYKIMLPGDYIAMKMSGRVSTTVSGLSEGIIWDYQSEKPANELLDYFEVAQELLPKAHSCFEITGELSSAAAEELQLKAGIPIAYRAGDQPNNAFSLNVLNPGEIATTAGTSGVIYGVTDQKLSDSRSRVNPFVHVNHSPNQHRYGILLCINGTGILNSWMKRVLGTDSKISYAEMNDIALQAPIGSDSLVFIPFGNGSERILEDRNVTAGVSGINFNRHKLSHLLRSAQEGIVFSMNYGLQIMKEMGMEVQTVKAGHSNMFLSPLFRNAFVNTTGASLELYNTDGAQGAARGAGVGASIYQTTQDAFKGLKVIDHMEPDPDSQSAYSQAYHYWLESLYAKLKF